MPEKSWKVCERKVAEKIGGIRNPLSGGSSRHTRGDIIHPKLYTEVKHNERNATIALMHRTEAIALKERKIPVVVQHVKGEKHYYVTVRLDIDHVRELSRAMTRAKQGDMPGDKPVTRK